MTRSVVVSRAALLLPDLELCQENRFYIPDGTFGGGETTQRRATSEGSQVKGRYASSIVEGSRTGNMSTHVIATEETLQAELDLVVAAMTQFRYLLQWYWDGLSGIWQCETADWALGSAGMIDVNSLKMHTQILHFTIPHNRISGF